MLEYKMKEGKGYHNFAKRTHWSQQTSSSNNTREDSTHGHHQKSDWLYSLQAKMEKCYTVSKNKTRNWLWLSQLVSLYSRSFNLDFSSTWTKNFQMCKLGLEKAEEPEFKLPTLGGSWRKQGSSRKTSTSASLPMLKPLIYCGSQETVEKF